MMANVIIKAMYGIVNVYSLLVGTVMTWAETAVEKNPYISGIVTGVVIWELFIK